MRVPEGFVPFQSLLNQSDIEIVVNSWSLKELLLKYPRSGGMVRQLGKANLATRQLVAMTNRLLSTPVEEIYHVLVHEPQLHVYFESEWCNDNRAMWGLDLLATFGIPEAPHPLHPWYTETITKLVRDEHALNQLTLNVSNLSKRLVDDIRKECLLQNKEVLWNHYTNVFGINEKRPATLLPCTGSAEN